MDLDVAKTICIVSLWLSTWLFTCAPYFLIASGESNPGHVRIRNKIISYLKCFAGGVFMSACFLNLLPSGMHSMEKYFRMIGSDTKFPAFMCIVALGFFIIAVVELIAHSLIHNKMEENSENKTTQNQISNNGKLHHHQNQNQNGGITETKFSGVALVSHNPAVGNGIVVHDQGNVIHHGNGHEHKNGHVIEQRAMVNGGQTSIEMIELGRKRDQKANNDELTSISNGVVEGGGGRNQTHTQGNVDGCHDEVADMLTVMQANPLRAFLLLAALSFHTVFDGLAVGLELTVKEVWEMFTAIIIHKSLVAVCLGLQLFLQYKDRPFRGVLWSLFFSIIAPIGIGIGMALTSGSIDETAKHLTNTFLQGLAAGTFVYVTFFEILKEEIVDNRGFKRLFLVALGFAAMGLVKYFA